MKNIEVYDFFASMYTLGVCFALAVTDAEANCAASPVRPTRETWKTALSLFINNSKSHPCRSRADSNTVVFAPDRAAIVEMRGSNRSF